MNRLKILLLFGLLLSGLVEGAHANEWIPVSGAETLKEFMSGLKAERTLAGGEISRGEYKADGTEMGSMAVPQPSMGCDWLDGERNQLDLHPGFLHLPARRGLERGNRADPHLRLGGRTVDRAAAAQRGKDSSVERQALETFDGGQLLCREIGRLWPGMDAQFQHRCPLSVQDCALIIYWKMLPTKHQSR